MIVKLLNCLLRSCKTRLVANIDMEEALDKIKVNILTGDHTALAVSSLHKWGCCPRCVLRFLGEKQPSVYCQSDQALARWVSSQMTGDENEASSRVTTSNGNHTEAAAAATVKLAGQVADSAAVDGGDTCVTCLGLLQSNFCSQQFRNKISETVEKENFHFLAFSCPITLPVTQILREHAIWVILKDLLPGVYSGLDESELTTLKDAWRFLNADPLAGLLQAPFQQQADFEVSLFFVHDKLNRECNFLFDIHPDLFRKHKNQREVFTRVRVSQALNLTSNEEFKQYYQCPPRRPDCACTCSLISCRHSAVYIAGRYNKYSRSLSQTPWFVDGGRKTESSIEELICTKIIELVRAADYRFSSSGREDVDVKMLGTGRPFVVELTNPHNAEVTQEQLVLVQKEINSSSDQIAVRHLQFVTRDDTSILKEGETAKKKSYCALCWSERELTQPQLDLLCTEEDLVISQKTPIRVLHRRPLAVREKVIHTMCAQLIDAHHFRLRLSTQAGTYIKEFVHGDFGRTHPNMCDLLNTDCDILELDVESVELEWPKSLT